MDLGLALVLVAQARALGASLLGAPVGVRQQVELGAQAVELGLGGRALVLELGLRLLEALLQLRDPFLLLGRAGCPGLELLAAGALGRQLVPQLGRAVGVGAALLLELRAVPRRGLGYRLLGLGS